METRDTGVSVCIYHTAVHSPVDIVMHVCIQTLVCVFSVSLYVLLFVCACVCVCVCVISVSLSLDFSLSVIISAMQGALSKINIKHQTP